MKKKILLGLTTTPDSDYREKVREIDKFEIKEIALFPTFLRTREERDELYSLLEKTNLESIPHVHLRGQDMGSDELDYLINKYNAKVFNIHSSKEFPINNDCFGYKKMIYIENTDFVPSKEDLEEFSGICFDISHMENYARENNSEYTEALDRLLKKYPIGCGHASAIKNEPQKDLEEFDIMRFSAHWMKDISEFDYVKKYINYIPEFLSIELENSFEEQLKVKEYLNSLINAND